MSNLLLFINQATARLLT